MKHILILFTATLLGCKYKNTDQLFYKNAQVLEIKRDDESEYHLLVRFQDGSVKSMSDVRCDIKTGHFAPMAVVPFVKWDNGYKKGTFEAWKYNQTAYNYMDIIVCLPLDYKIELFAD